ncbi:hypothetical protein [Chitinophaga solisilvae]|uniref:Uncharacterized protein n=1 Tax=Chitinophaga solisilvae TaxID=1233460 RepID=A0A3S1CYW8_9BACT|nr:hypothetical protein [Chitinophaga solisilvae]NSL88164.1 hypothetical protein [Chitinophaga solisilvae]
MNKKTSFKGIAALTLVACLIMVLLISGIASARRITRTTCKPASGQVQDVKQGAPGIVVHLKNDPRIYFIRSTTIPGSNAATLERELAGKEVQLYISADWDPLDPFSSMKEIRRLQTGDHVIFSSF